jgi:hypothetical protein
MAASPYIMRSPRRVFIGENLRLRAGRAASTIAAKCCRKLAASVFNFTTWTGHLFSGSKLSTTGQGERK